MARRKKSRFGAFLFGILFGIIATLGGIGYGLYWSYENLSVAKIEGLTKQTIVENDTLKNMTIKKLTQEIALLPDMTINTFSSTYGITLPEGIGFLINALDGIAIKDIPNSALDSILTKVKLGEIFGSPYNDFETYPESYDGEIPEEATEKLFFELRHKTISGENGISSFFNDLTLGDVESLLGFTLPSMLASVPKDTKMTDLGTAIENVPVNDILPKPTGWVDSDPDTHDVNDNDDFSNVILKRLFNMRKLPTPEDEVGLYTISEMSEIFSRLPEEILISDILKTDSASPSSMSNNIINLILREGGSISQISTTLSNVLEELTVSNLFGEPAASEGIFKLLRGKNTDNTLKVLKINDLSTTGTENIRLAKLEDFQEAGIINATTDLNKEIPYNGTLVAMKTLSIDELLEAISDIDFSLIP